ncbi:MAG: XdhC/CoxI family protein [Candidatus Caldarchaeales archaeon]
MSNLDVLEAAIKEIKNGRKAVIATIVKKTGSAPRDAGTKMLIREDGTTVGTIGGGSFEMMVWRDSMEALREGKPIVKKYFFRKEATSGGAETGLICGGEVEVYMDVLKPTPRIILIGAGHISEAISKIVSMLGYRIVIVDSNPEFANKDRFPMAEQIFVSNDFRDWVDGVKPAESDLILIVYGEIEEDYKALTSALKTHARYIGLLGSRRKCAEFLRRLRGEGYKDEELLGRLYMPVGIDIGADTPEEISVAIVAEIIKIQRGGELKHLTLLK